MVWKKGKKKKRRAQTLQAIGMKILLPVFLALFGLFICLFVGLHETRILGESVCAGYGGTLRGNRLTRIFCR